MGPQARVAAPVSAKVIDARGKAGASTCSCSRVCAGPTAGGSVTPSFSRRLSQAGVASSCLASRPAWSATKQASAAPRASRRF